MGGGHNRCHHHHLGAGGCILYKSHHSTCVHCSSIPSPIAGSLFGTVLISLLLLPVLIAPYICPLTQEIWVIVAP